MPPDFNAQQRTVPLQGATIIAPPARLFQATEQLMSWPQHSGDFILPWPFGHFEI